MSAKTNRSIGLDQESPCNRASTADAARRQLKALGSWLESNGHVDTAESLREGLEETLMVLTLGLPPRLQRLFATASRT